MKRFLIKYLFAFVICTIVASCSSSEDYKSPLIDRFVEDVVIVCDASAYSQTINFSNDADLSKIAITSSESWCTASVKGSSIVINVEKNDSYDERTANITFRDVEDETTRHFGVTQQQNDAILVDKTTYDVDEAGGTIEIEVKSNVDYQVEISDGWISLDNSNTRGLKLSKITLKVLRNTSGDVRQAIVKIIDSNSGEYANVTIKQAFTPHLITYLKEMFFDENGGEVEVNVTTNMDIDVSIDNNWVEVSQKYPKDEVNMVYVFKAQPLPEIINRRRGAIFFRNSKWDIAETIEVFQTRSFYIEESSLELYVGDVYSLNLVKNIPGGVYWESSDTYVATVDYNGTISAHHPGSTQITVYTGDFKYYDQINVTVQNIDILSQLSSDFVFEGPSDVSGQGDLSGYYISCTLHNNSDKDLKLQSCKVIKDNNVVTVISPGFSVLGAGRSTSCGTPLSDLDKYEIEGSYIFIWEFTLYDYSYSYQCESPYYYKN